jgi:hypothetical protein
MRESKTFSFQNNQLVNRMIDAAIVSDSQATTTNSVTNNNPHTTETFFEMLTKEAEYELKQQEYF